VFAQIWPEELQDPNDTRDEIPGNDVCCFVILYFTLSDGMILHRKSRALYLSLGRAASVCICPNWGRNIVCCGWCLWADSCSESH
jgi:hypothetical protein